MNVNTADGAILNVETFGTADKPKLILSNSLGTDISMWEKQVDALSSQFHIACYDTRGHGKTQAPAGEFTIDMLGADVLAVADELGWETFNFAGVSMGGMTGFWLAINAAERLLKVIAASGGPKAGSPEVWNSRIEGVKKDGLAPLENSIERWFTEDFVSANADLIKALKSAHANCSAEGYIGCCAALRDMDLRSGLASITTPMLILAGEYDTTPPPQVLKMAADHVTGSEFKTIPAGHLSNVQADKEFNEALVAFFAE